MLEFITRMGYHFRWKVSRKGRNRQNRSLNMWVEKRWMGYHRQKFSRKWAKNRWNSAQNRHSVLPGHLVFDFRHTDTNPHSKSPLNRHVRRLLNVKTFSTSIPPATCPRYWRDQFKVWKIFLRPKLGTFFWRGFSVECQETNLSDQLNLS